MRELLDIQESSKLSADQDIVELDLKKNFFYVVNPESEIINCAKIYSFLHEQNIYRRFVARVIKDADDRI
jgi:hypothetical protein